ncbi:RHS repeat domain-containing protein [Pseudobutyrivibrio sp. NOR37]|nr:RHS repeat-associated core domain-containing protein [Pseudobutyrivibrio sp. NOR37]
MTSIDKEGVLDKYFYTYDNSGYISEINRNRRALDAVSGKYEYSYDAIGRLIKSTLDGAIKAEYQYDAFGNRTSLTEGNTSTTYSYDVLDRLLEVNELNNNQSVVKTYDYDKRGNQTNEYVDGVLNKTFTFDATGMMSKVTDAVKGQQEDLYNGLGFRVETTRPEEHIEYLCDLSKDYFNLLERTVNGEKESFVYDKNVISMSKKGSNFYYLQDELGSPMYLTGTDGVAVSSYAFDDFGRNIDPRTGKQKHGYTKDGNIIQPFAFTGYQEDEFSGLKFAQARFYDARVGRFESRDKVKGFTHAPFTLNNYSYCFNNPLGLVDRDGNWPELLENACDWVADKASDAGKAISDAASDAGKAISDAASGAKKAIGDFAEDTVNGVKAVGKFVYEHPKEIAITAAAVGVTLATGGAGAALFVAGASVTCGAVNAYTTEGDKQDAFAQGMMLTSVGLTAGYLNPAGTAMGLGGQFAADVFINNKISSPEVYVAAAVGGSVGNIDVKGANALGGMAAGLTNNILSGERISIFDVIRSGVIGGMFDGLNLGLEISPASIKYGINSIFNPLYYSSNAGGQTIGNILDDIGRAVFGLNGSSDIGMNILNSITDEICSDD